MTVSRVQDFSPAGTRSAELRAWLVAILAASLWFEVLLDAARHASGLPLAPWLAAAAGLATQLAFTAAEAGVATLAWRVAGERVRWRALAPRLLAVSSAEAFAVAVAAGHTAIPSVLAPWLAGPRAAGGPPPASGLVFAFAAFGALTAARMLLSAHAQAGVARVSFARGLVLVLALYLATRLVMWWSFDLMQGRSFQLWGIAAWVAPASNA